MEAVLSDNVFRPGVFAQQIPYWWVQRD